MPSIVAGRPGSAVPKTTAALSHSPASRRPDVWRILIWGMIILAFVNSLLMFTSTAKTAKVERVADASFASIHKEQDNRYKAPNILIRGEEHSGLRGAVRTGWSKDPSRLSVIYDRDTIMNRMRYWLPGNSALIGRDPKLPAVRPGKYLMMGTDCGGFNNIRMVFEVLTALAVLMGRTLILPPPQGWYLLDWGPMVREGEEGKQSTYEMFWDVDGPQGLQKQHPVLSTRSFMQQILASNERQFAVQIPDTFINKTDQEFDVKSWFSLWREKYPSMDWNFYDKVLYFPDAASIQNNVPSQKITDITDNRKVIEYSPDLVDQDVLIFPPDCPDYRYLSQIAAFAILADESMEHALHRLIRDNIHYREQVFDIASRVVAHLGMFNYISMHVRRNDLQYKEMFQGASDMLGNLKPLWEKTKIRSVYISTDEKSDGFFRAFGEAGYKVYTWYDFYNSKDNDVLRDVDIPVKLVGLVEQVICAMGKIFIGTRMSSFTSYIPRLRGYMHAPDQNLYYHNDKYTGYEFADTKIMREPIRGHEYLREFPVMWEESLDDIDSP